MILGKIDYLNLLPFHVFLKRYALQSGLKKAIEFKKGVPSKLNKDLRKRLVDGAVISSIESFNKRYKRLNFGIVAKKEVRSVLVRKNSTPSLDAASATSNALSKMLGVYGEVIIGDRALKAFLNEGGDKFYDLAKIWNEKTNLPFVFGRFSCVKHSGFYKKLIENFSRKNVKIPGYILKRYSITRGISPENIKRYLKLISYKIGEKEKKSLAKFAKEVRILKAGEALKPRRLL